MSTFVNFTPSTLSAFTFQPKLNGTLYNATVTWNVYRQDYYITISTLSGVLVVCEALVASGPIFQSLFTWAVGTVTATVTINHNVPVGWVAKAVISQTGTNFDGGYEVLSTSPTTLTYNVANNDSTSAQPIGGVVNFNLNLVAGYNIGWLLFHDNTQQFEFAS